MSLFRKQAVRQYADPDARGGLLRVTPPSGLRVFAALAALFLVLAVLAVTQRVNVTARGRGVVRPSEGIFIVEAPGAGRVSSVPVAAGSKVERGEVIAVIDPLLSPTALFPFVRLAVQWRERAQALGDDRAAEAEALERASRELRAAVDDRAGERLEIVAPRAGRLDAITLREGDMVAVGDAVAKVVPSEGALVALLAIPAEHRAELQPGRKVRLSLDEHPAEEAGFGEATIARVSSDPLSREVTDPLLSQLVDGDVPRYLVELTPDRMPARVDGGFDNGMIFTGEVVLREQRIISVLFPPLAAVLDR